jgi:hypothetical protein
MLMAMSVAVPMAEDVFPWPEFALICLTILSGSHFLSRVENLLHEPVPHRRVAVTCL